MFKVGYLIFVRSNQFRQFSKIFKSTMASKFQPVKIVNPTAKQTGTIFFFHGAGDTGPGIAEWVKELTGDKFNFPHLKIIFPTAPAIPYTAQGGEVCNVWFDRYATSFHVPEHKETLEQTCKDLVTFIEEEMNKSNLSKDRVIFGGYSMGGAMALHLAFNYFPNIAGVFAMSSFLNHDTKIYDIIEEKNSRCPLFMAHGRQDGLVNYEWGHGTFTKLKKIGVGGEFRSFNGDHELNLNVVLNLKDWINNIVPENTKKET